MSTKISKTEFTSLVAAGEAHESFEHSIHGMFDVTLMRERAKEVGNLIEVHIVESDMVNHVTECRVYEEKRIRNLPRNSWLGDSGVNDPILYVRFPNPGGQEHHLLIDGSHRILRRHREGLPTVWAYVLEQEDIIRPDYTTMGDARDVLGVDWGDEIIDGKIIKGAKSAS